MELFFLFADKAEAVTSCIFLLLKAGRYFSYIEFSAQAQFFFNKGSFTDSVLNLHINTVEHSESISYTRCMRKCHEFT